MTYSELSTKRSRLSSKGFGKKMPVADNSTGKSRAKNRRISLVLVQ